MAVYNKDHIVSLLCVEIVEDNSFTISSKNFFSNENVWKKGSRTIDFNDYVKTHMIIDDKVFMRPYVRICFVNGEIIKVYKNTNKEAHDYYMNLSKSIRNPLFL